MDSAASPPAKRAAPRVVAKAKRLILPPESEELAADNAPVDPGVRAKRPVRQPRSRPVPPDPGMVPGEPDDGAGPTGGAWAMPPAPPEAAGEAVRVESTSTVMAPSAPDVDDGTLADDAEPLFEPSVPRGRVAPPPSGPPIELPAPDWPEVEPVQPALFDGEIYAAERPMRSLRQPVTLTRRRRPRVRRVTRVVRHVDSWSVFKIALLFNLFFYVVCVTASVLLWQVAQSTGTVDNVQRFFEGFGWESFKLKGGELYHNLWVIGLFLVVLATGLAVLMATMFNLITDLVGGVRVTVLEEEVVSRVKLTTLASTAAGQPASPAPSDAQPGEPG